MRKEQTADWIRRELHGALDHMRDDLDRIEILTAALSAFSKPVPGYEPTFHHMRSELPAYKLD